MAKVKLQAGAEFDLLTKGELDESLQKAEAREVAALSGLKDIRFQLVGTVSANACTIGDPSTASAGGILAGPESGYVWSVKHLVIEGLTAAAVGPDVMNIYRAGRIIWQLNGNQFSQTWGSGQILLKAGEVVYAKNSGNLAATGSIVMHGTAWEVPSQLIGKLI